MGERLRPLPGGPGAVRWHQTNRVRHVGFLARLALTWATIVAVIVLAVWADSWPVTVAAIVAVATRQIVLGLLTSRSTTWACPSAPATPWSTSWPAFRSCS